jgi:hypothetical protein
MVFHSISWEPMSGFTRCEPLSYVVVNGLDAVVPPLTLRGGEPAARQAASSFLVGKVTW